MPEENQPLPNNDSLSPNQGAQEALPDKNPSLEKELISRWRGSKGEQTGEVTSRAEDAGDNKKMLPQEREAIFKQKKFEPFAPEIATPPPTKPPVSDSSEPEELPVHERSWIRLILNIFIVVLVVGSAALAGYWYTRRNISQSEEKIPELPISNGELPPPVDIPQPPSVPPESTYPGTPQPPETEPGVVEPVSAWSRLKNEPLGYVVWYPQNWYLYPEEAGTSDSAVYISSKALASIPATLDEVEVAASDLLVIVDPPIEEGEAKIWLKPEEYATEYNQIVEKILQSFKLFTSVEAAPVKDYVNTIDNFSLKYPENWRDLGLESSDLGLFKKFANETGEVNLSIGTLLSATLESFANKNADAAYFGYLQQQKEGVERTIDSIYRITKYPEMTIGGKSTVKQQEVSESEFNVAYYVLKNGAVLRILVNFTSKDQWLNYEQALEGILGTIQFQ